ncbi:MAG: redoxin domain-containing protein [Saprospiraceae bacterium]|nr:redoxin domain-containing protein [Saprospiraceae bacterium]
MKQFILFLILLPITCFCAKAPDFTVTDYNQKTHRLYADYLNHEKVVVLKLFFVDCPPCNSIAPTVQQSYVKWGSGKDRVEFIELSTQNWDQNNNVKGYAQKHGLTFPGVGFDGGGFAATAPYKSGTFGPYYGTPTMLVIAPDGEVTFNITYTRSNQVNLDSAIAKALRVKSGGGGPDPDPVRCKDSFGIKFLTEIKPDAVYIRNLVDPVAPEFTLLDYKYNCEYAFPEAKDFYFLIPTKNTPANFNYSGITTQDIILIQRHILGMSQLTSLQLAAADVNNSGTVTTADINELRKFILGITDRFQAVSSPYTWAINPFLKSQQYTKSVRLLDMIQKLKSNEFGMAQYGDVSGASQFKEDDEILMSRANDEFVIKVLTTKNNEEFLHEVFFEFNNNPITGIQLCLNMSSSEVFGLSFINSDPSGLGPGNAVLSGNSLLLLWSDPFARNYHFNSNNPILTFKSNKVLDFYNCITNICEIIVTEGNNLISFTPKFVFERKLGPITKGSFVTVQTGSTPGGFGLHSVDLNIVGFDVFNLGGRKIPVENMEGLNTSKVKFTIRETGLFIVKCMLESGETESLKFVQLR